MEPFEASLPPDLMRLQGLRHELGKWLDSVGVPPEHRDAVVLAIHEAAANGIEHACGRVTVRGVVDDDKLILIVSNTGRWRGPLHADLGRGRGLALMRALVSNLEISRGPEGTTVRMRMNLPGARSETSDLRRAASLPGVATGSAASPVDET